MWCEVEAILLIASEEEHHNTRETSPQLLDAVLTVFMVFFEALFCIVLLPDKVEYSFDSRI
jgi:hypothetical protein